MGNTRRHIDLQLSIRASYISSDFNLLLAQIMALEYLSGSYEPLAINSYCLFAAQENLSTRKETHSLIY